MPTTPAGEIGHDDVVGEVQLWFVENPPAPRAVASTLEGTPEVPPSPELARACRSAGRGVTINSPSIRISDALNVDLAPDGTVYGIELLNANEQLQAGDNGTLVVINEALGQRREISLVK